MDAALTVAMITIVDALSRPAIGSLALRDILREGALATAALGGWQELSTS